MADLNSLFGQHGAVQLVRGQTAQRVDTSLFVRASALFDGLALDHLGGDGGRGDGAAAAKRLELDVLDAVVLDLEVHLHDVAALGVADLADAVRVRESHRRCGGCGNDP